MKRLNQGLVSIALQFALLFVLSNTAFSQAPQLINFQAQLEGVTASSASVTFEIFPSSTGGTAIWSETHPTLPVTGGRIQVLLGSEEDFDPGIFEGDGDRYLQITVNGETIARRSQLSSVSYALRAAVADKVLDGGGGGGIATINEGSGIDVSDSDGPVTEIGIEPNSINDDYVADNSLTAGSLATNSVGSDELQNAVVLGPSGSLELTNNSNQTATVVSSNGEDGLIQIKEQPGNYNAVELSARTSGLGGEIVVRGNDQFSAIQMFADSDTDGGRVVLREPRGGSVGQSVVLTATDGAGRVVLINADGTAIALKGHTQSILTKGKIGIGMSGDLNSVEPSHDLEVNGSADISGNLSKGGGSFTIDHPMDPLNKKLRHSFVESPDMMNVYNGNVLLDANGKAWVILPDWFETLNKDFRYQLTTIGGFAPVYIAKRIENNRFKIAGGTPNLEVSWQVTGIRDDPYAQLHRIIVEEEKNTQDQGKYIHPDAYNMLQPN